MCRLIKTRRNGYIFAVLFLSLCFGVMDLAFSQEGGFKYFKNYTKADHGRNAQNWGIQQGPGGLIYVANHDGLLEYDGVSWRVYDIPGYSVRSLAIDETGTIWVGGESEIGFFSRLPDGSLKYTSLTPKIKKEHQGFSAVNKTHSTQNGIFFRAKKFLFRWNPKAKKMMTWKSPGKLEFNASFVCGGKYYIHVREYGLMDVTGDSLKLVPGGEIFASKKIFMMVPLPGQPQKIVVGTQDKGFFIYDSLALTLTPFPMEADKYLAEKKLYHGIPLKSSPNEIALATLEGGLVIIDSTGKLERILDKNSGINDDGVMYIYEDSQGNLWLALNNGISKIEYTSPFFIYDSRSGLEGSVLSVSRHKGVLYAGSSKGLYFLDSSYFPSSFSFAKWTQVPGIAGNCYSLLSAGDSLLAAATGGVFEVNHPNRVTRKIIEGNSYVLYRSKKNPDKIWAGTQKGLVPLFLENNRWVPGPLLEKITQSIYSIVETPDGHLWLGTKSQGVIKVDFTGGGSNKEPAITHYLGSNGLPPGEIRVFEAANHIMFGTEMGIYRFDQKKRNFIPDNTLGKDFAGGSRNNVFRLVQDNDRTIWFHSRNKNFRAIHKPNGSYSIDSITFLRIPPAQVNAFYPDPAGHFTWFACDDGLIGFDKRNIPVHEEEYTALVRKVSIIGEKSPVFDGCILNGNSRSKPPLPRFRFEDRNLRIEFAAPFFEGETSTQYQVRLEGYDEKLSPFTSETRKDYTNLDVGVYTFKVRAKNIFGRLSSTGVYRFQVLPIWYRTWWAYTIYAAALFFSVFFVFKWRSHVLEKEKKRLERIVTERTLEINRKKLQLEKQTMMLEEQSGKLKEMDRVKSRFFANISHEFRTPLTLIMGPLEQMIPSAGDWESKEQMNVMYRSANRLLALINQLLDLSKLDSGKMKLQAGRYNIIPFLKGILESFHLLTQQNKLDLRFISAKDDITLYFDPAKLEDVVCNLMINAVKFTPPGGSIIVCAREKTGTAGIDPSNAAPGPGMLEISIRDTGIGIPKDQLAHIFDRFYQVEASAASEHSYKGTGIGLSLARELVCLHHGEMDVQSDEGENRGTEFIIRLPMGEEHLKPEEISNHTGLPCFSGKSDDLQSIYLQEEGNGERCDNGPGTGTGNEIYGVETGENEEGKEKEKTIILVVEDNKDVRDYIRRPLEPLHGVVEAANGKEGIKLAKSVIPDLIVSDIMMPEGDGYELCREIKKDIATSHIPVILLTAKASEESIIQGLKTGADDYITKPFNSKILCARIENLIELRRQMQLKIQRQKMLLPAEISVSSMDEEFLKEFQGIIEKNLSDPELDIETLCKVLYMGRATLFRKILALTGETPKQFIQSYRLERAAQLLKSRFGNITEVAFEVGFSSTAYFTKCFKEKFNRVPSAFVAAEV